MQDGGLYAGYIAMRDIEHCYDYTPLVYNAFMAGQLPVNIAKAIFENQRKYVKYITFKEYMKGPHETFDVSTMLTGGMPASIPAIIATVKAHCPVKEVIYATYSDKRRIQQMDWIEKYGKRFTDLAFEFEITLLTTALLYITKNKQPGMEQA